MPRNMSFSMTTDAIRDRSKTVTRRLGWNFLQPGDLLWAVEKGMGLKKGEKVKRLALIRVVSTEWVSLYGTLAALDTFRLQDEMAAEGFPRYTAEMFTAMFCKHNRCEWDGLVNRIEFDYVEGE